MAQKSTSTEPVTVIEDKSIRPPASTFRKRHSTTCADT
jgi:hypothetical protein